MSAPSTVAPEDASKKRKEPSAQEVAQAAFMDALFTREKSAVMQQHVAKKPKVAAAGASSSNAFVNAMDKNAATAEVSARAIQPFTDNGAVSHSTTKSSNLDLFYHLMRNYDAQALLDLLPQCWVENPEIMLQVLLHGRDCHGSGKGERLVVYYSLLWLRAYKPQTYLLNLLNFLRAGYFKDLLQIVELLEGRSTTPTKHWKPAEKEGAAAGGAASGKKKPAAGKKGGRAAPVKKAETPALEPVIQKLAQAAGGSASPIGSTDLELSLIAEYLKADFVSMKKWRAARKAFNDAKKGASPSPAAPSTDSSSWYEEGDFATKTTEDGWEEVSDANSNMSKLSINENYMADVASTTSTTSSSSSSTPAPAKIANEVVNGVSNPGQLFISLAAKYAPSEGKHFSASAKRIAAMLFAPEGNSLKSNGFSNKKHEQSCLKKYRQILSALRMQLNLIERKICKGLWNKINFNAVPSRCHLLLKKAFARHTPEAYTAYLEGLKKGKGKINVMGLEPHQLVKNYLNRGAKEVEETVEAAWRALVQKTRECGTFKSAVSIVDVSGSMSGTPMEVAISMGLMISALSEGPFQGRCLTFDANPVWHTITGETLKEQVECLAAAPWGGNTDLIKSFELILSIAVNNKIPQSQLPQTLFIFSDMQFDEAMGNDWMKTNHQVIKGRFEAAGYKLPNIVYWNVNGQLNKDAPVTMDTPGCALMAGFSADLFKVFLSTPMEELMATSVEADPEKKKADPLSPLNIMMKAIESYRVEVEESER